MTRIVIIILVMALTSCSDRSVNEYEDVNLVHLVLDLQTAKIAVEKSGKPNRDSLAEVYHQQILSMHKIDQVRLDEILDEFQDRPELIDSIYLEVNKLVDSLKSSTRSQPEI